MDEAKESVNSEAGVRVAIIVVGDSFCGEEEEVISKSRKYLTEEGHTVVRLDRVPASLESIQSMLRECMENEEIASIIVMGRTGISPGDVTLEAVDHFAEKEMPAFSAVFSQMCYEDIGPPAIVQRAEAFGSEGKAIFVIPLSKVASKKGVKKLIAPNLSEIVGGLRG